MQGVREHLTRTTLPDGRQVRLPPAAVETGRREFPLAPRYAEHTRKILEETGLEESAIDDLVREGVVR
jgi:crotonobetainyl-CoA:carnitine CoA-transferase CaiB-like acyl-CoA transferase